MKRLAKNTPKLPVKSRSFFLTALGVPYNDEGFQHGFSEEDLEAHTVALPFLSGPA